MFRDFGRKLLRDIKRIVDARLKVSEDLSGGRIKVTVVSLVGTSVNRRLIGWMPKPHTTNRNYYC